MTDLAIETASCPGAETWHMYTGSSGLHVNRTVLLVLKGWTPSVQYIYSTESKEFWAAVPLTATFPA